MNNLFIQDIAIDLWYNLLYLLLANQKYKATSFLWSAAAAALFLRMVYCTAFIKLDLRAAFIIDFIWTLIPILMIILITIPTFAILFELDKLHKILIKLVAIGNQWFWT